MGPEKTKQACSALSDTVPGWPSEQRILWRGGNHKTNEQVSEKKRKLTTQDDDVVVGGDTVFSSVDTAALSSVTAAHAR